ncbi:MAG: hypothetical protein PUH99_03490 [Firmicutes bacterium]|nr:hypothetical protein [Bacillota bacterium]MDY5531958.1 hypothetical protein [Pumilibacteraceae bacterium]
MYKRLFASNNPLRRLSPPRTPHPSGEALNSAIDSTVTFNLLKYKIQAQKIPPSSRKRTKPPPLQSKGGFKEVVILPPLPYEKKQRVHLPNNPESKVFCLLVFKKQPDACPYKRSKKCVYYHPDSKVFCLLFFKKVRGGLHKIKLLQAKKKKRLQSLAAENLI